MEDKIKQGDTPRVLLVEDDPSLRAALETTLSLKGIEHCSFPDAESALGALHNGNWYAVVSDIRLPKMSGLELLSAIRKLRPALPVVLMTAFADAQTAVQALKGGARDFLLKPFKPDQFLEVVRRYLPSGDDHSPSGQRPVATDPVSVSLFQTLERVAQTDASVLILGESGVGKEVMAQFLHQHSRRHKGPFVAINCAAIPSTLLEATLFGHERGAFTGANKLQQGKFELAQGGTIFLDEIGEMPSELQTKLLRVLQERQVERVGSHNPIGLDIRIITATNQDLSRRVSEGRFREDLYYRINVFPIKVPALRERTSDIVPLAERFLYKYRSSMGQPEAQLSESAKYSLQCYDWPGNVRELENVIQRALLLCDGMWIQPKDFAIDLEKASAPHSVENKLVTDLSESTSPANVKAMERDYILKVLTQVEGNRRRAIELLGISERTLRYKLKLWREEGYEIP